MMEVISENVQGNRTDMIPGDTYIMMNFYYKYLIYIKISIHQT